MNYKIRITAENQAIVKRIADENGMNPNYFEFFITESFYIIKENKFYVGNVGYNENIFCSEASSQKNAALHTLLALFADTSYLIYGVLL